MAPPRRAAPQLLTPSGYEGGVSRRSVLLAAIAALAVAVLPATASGAEYSVITCAGQPAGVTGWGAFTGGSFPASTGENCGSSGGAMVATLRGNTSTSPGNAGWQTYAPAGTTIAGATLYRSVVVNGGTYYDYIARGVTPAGAATYPTIETCSGTAACKTLSAKPSFAWRAPRGDVNRIQLYVQCAPPVGHRQLREGRQRRGRDRAHHARRPRAQRHERADDQRRPVELDVHRAGAGQRRADRQHHVQGRRRRRGGHRHPGRRPDQQRAARPDLHVPRAVPLQDAVPGERGRQGSSSTRPSVPDGVHQIRVYARDATGTNVGYSKTYTVTTSARGAVNGTNGSDQVKLTVRARKVVRAGPQGAGRTLVDRHGRLRQQGRRDRHAGELRGPAGAGRAPLGADRGRPRRAAVRVDPRRRGHLGDRRLQVRRAGRALGPRADLVLRPRAGHRPRGAGRRAHEGHHEGQRRRRAPQRARRHPRPRSRPHRRALPPAGRPRRAPGPARCSQLDHAGHRGVARRRHLQRQLPLHEPARAGATSSACASAITPASRTSWATRTT